VQEVDPVCGMKVGQESKYRSLYRGKLYFFCSPACKKEFDEDPERYLSGGPRTMGCCRATVREKVSPVWSSGSFWESWWMGGLRDVWSDLETDDEGNCRHRFAPEQAPRLGPEEDGRSDHEFPERVVDEGEGSESRASEAGPVLPGGAREGGGTKAREDAMGGADDQGHGEEESQDDDAESGREEDWPSGHEAQAKEKVGQVGALPARQVELKVVGMHCATCAITVLKALRSVKGVEAAGVSLASGQALVRMNGGNQKELVDAVRSSGYDVLTASATMRVEAGPDEAARVRQRLESVDGVVRASFNPGSGMARVEFNPFSVTAEKVIQELRSSGFRVETGHEEREVPEVESARRELRSMERRLAVAVAFTLPSLASLYLGVAWLALLLSVPVQFYSGLTFHRGAWRALKNRTTNMDTLVSLASNVAWL